MDEAEGGDSQALERAMDDRRNEIRKRWNVVARDAGMSTQHLSRIRRGEVPLTEFASRGLDRALDWTAGTALSYYRTGQAPSEADRPKPGSEAWWEDLARKLPEKDFWEVVEHAKMLKAQIPKRLAQRLAEYTERNRATQSRA